MPGNQEPLAPPTGPALFATGWEDEPPLLGEDFEGGALPAGWSLADNGNGTAWGGGVPEGGTGGPGPQTEPEGGAGVGPLRKATAVPHPQRPGAKALAHAHRAGLGAITTELTDQRDIAREGVGLEPHRHAGFAAGAG